MKTLYDVLHVTRTSSLSEIKQSYRSLILKYHPDKISSSLSDRDQTFLLIQHAWNVLKDQKKREQYDSLQEERLRVGPCHDIVHLSDMSFSEGYFEAECRCGGTFEVSMSDVELDANIAHCTNCSLHILLEYEISDLLAKKV